MVQAVVFVNRVDSGPHHNHHANVCCHQVISRLYIGLAVRLYVFILFLLTIISLQGKA